MGKRKRVTKSLEEAERGMYKTFSSAANAVSLLYTQAQSQQKRAYYGGMQDAFEKVLKWVDSKNIPSNGVQRQALTDFIHHELDAVESETPAPIVSMEAAQFKVPPPTSQHRFVSNLNPLSSPVRRALLKSSVHKGSEHRTAGSVGAGETSNDENDVQMSKLDI